MGRDRARASRVWRFYRRLRDDPRAIENRLRPRDARRLRPVESSAGAPRSSASRSPAAAGSRPAGCRSSTRSSAWPWRRSCCRTGYRCSGGCSRAAARRRRSCSTPSACSSPSRAPRPRQGHHETDAERDVAGTADAATLPGGDAQAVIRADVRDGIAAVAVERMRPHVGDQRGGRAPAHRIGAVLRRRVDIAKRVDRKARGHPPGERHARQSLQRDRSHIPQAPARHFNRMGEKEKTSRPAGWRVGRLTPSRPARTTCGRRPRT